MRVMGLAGLLVALVGCDADVDCEEAAAVAPTLRVGVGEYDYAPIDHGDVVEVDHGGQGGSHIWVSLRTEGLVPGRVFFGAEKVPAPSGSFSLWDRWYSCG